MTLNTIPHQREAFLEKFLRFLRLKKVVKIIKTQKDCDLLDIGCGTKASLLKTISPYIKSGIGVDFKPPTIHTEKIKTIEVNLEDKLPFCNSSFSAITMLAVLEHLQYPSEILTECSRLLKHNGLLLITTPTWQAKPVLEFLAFKMGLVDKNEILDHKCYFNKADLFLMVSKINDLQIIKHEYFQVGFNNFLVIQKN